jgi:hypothetical protein
MPEMELAKEEAAKMRRTSEVNTLFLKIIADKEINHFKTINSFLLDKHNFFNKKIS